MHGYVGFPHVRVLFPTCVGDRSMCVQVSLRSEALGWGKPKNKKWAGNGSDLGQVGMSSNPPITPPKVHSNLCSVW